ncbi:hypothetical protein [Microbacterium dextranolyticum]|uniref:Uncharacterized protein n=1 Tax=Microbacterium dextranolyticum TaxID=36806 RepID=A0A9W6HKB9_9MICO|nr:hypothetical protein [Microbacterium dextranolyticum]MBM7461852.1 hypothetical protein [Microbacterium dextranolyticum]GLJ94093.1 hypothetical protein GCM10017591_01540 [Microbacterium dextranolyticum]
MNEQIAALAAASGWRYEAEGDPLALGEGLWEQASSGVVRDKVSGDGWEAGNITGGDRSASRTEQRGRLTITRTVSVATPERSMRIEYLAMTPPRRLPHLLIDATGNGRERRQRPTRDRRLSLEGDFDRHFHLYAPRGYERDALSVFMTDLMALLIDETGDLDVEVRDDQLIVLRPGGVDLADPATWQRFARIRATVGQKAWSQTDLYADERAAPPSLTLEGSSAANDEAATDATNTVAREDRRLRRKIPTMVWIGVGIAAAALAFAGTVLTIVFTALTRVGG